MTRYANPIEIVSADGKSIVLSPSGLRLPSYTTSERDADLAPEEGDIIYNATESREEVYRNGAWMTLGTIITVSDTPPADPAVGDLWIDLS